MVQPTLTSGQTTAQVNFNLQCNSVNVFEWEHVKSNSCAEVDFIHNLRQPGGGPDTTGMGNTKYNAESVKLEGGKVSLRGEM